MSIISVAFNLACFAIVMSVVISAIIFVLEIFRSIQSVHERCSSLEKELNYMQDTNAKQMKAELTSIRFEQLHIKKTTDNQMKDIKEIYARLELIDENMIDVNARVSEIDVSADQTRKQLDNLNAKKINNHIAEIYESLSMIHRRIMSSNDSSSKLIGDIQEGMDMIADRLVALEEHSSRRHGNYSRAFHDYESDTAIYYAERTP
jgi:regulator of sigma D